MSHAFFGVFIELIYVCGTLLGTWLIVKADWRSIINLLRMRQAVGAGIDLCHNVWGWEFDGLCLLGLERILGQLCAKKCVNFRWLIGQHSDIGQQFSHPLSHAQKTHSLNNSLETPSFSSIFFGNGMPWVLATCLYNFSISLASVLISLFNLCSSSVDPSMHSWVSLLN